MRFPRATLVLLAAAAVVSTLALAVSAVGDTPRCVSGSEYDNTTRGLTVGQVANRYDQYGDYIGDSDGGAHQRREYRTCWAPGERRVIVEFDYDTGGSVDWYVRDVA